MRLYTGCHCAACNKPFLETDDVVVCPECGAPHHRSCWNELGHCAHEAEHASGYVWVNDSPTPKPEEPAPRQDTARTPAEDYSAPFNGAATQVIGPEDEFGSIKSKDWACFIRKAVPYYMLRFFQMEATHQKISLSLSAFIFGPMYFYYRKMYRWAAIYTALYTLCYLPTLILFWYDTGSSFTVGMNPQTWIFIANISGYLNMAIKILAGLFATYLYKAHASQKIKLVYSTTNEDSARFQLLSRMGGTNLLAPILFLVGFTVIVSALMVAFAGPNLYQTLQAYTAQLGAL